MKILRKYLVSDYEPFVRAILAEDLDFLKTYNTNPAKALDMAALDVLGGINDGDLFFIIENRYGSIVGYLSFAVPTVAINFHIRKGPFRTDEYIKSFWDLVDVTFNNDFFTSVGGANLSSLPGLLVSAFTIKNDLQFHGKNFVLLKVNI